MNWRAEGGSCVAGQKAEVSLAGDQPLAKQEGSKRKDCENEDGSGFSCVFYFSSSQENCRAGMNLERMANNGSANSFKV
jgi:hypothetical protein